MIKLRVLRQIVLDYPCGPDIVIIVLVRGKNTAVRGRREGYMMTAELEMCGLEMEQGSTNPGKWWPLETERGKEIHSLLRVARGNRAC